MGLPACALPAPHWQREAIAFFDHIIQGADNGYVRQAPVQYHHDGTGDDCRPQDHGPRNAARYHFSRAQKPLMSS